MPVTYNSGSNLITVTGGTLAVPLTFEDILTANDAGAWGVVTKQGLAQYRIAADINFGTTGGADWSFKDTSKMVAVTGASIHYNGTAFGVFQLGELSAGGEPINGCVYELRGQTAQWPKASGEDLGDIYLYASTMRIGGFWRHYGTNGDIAIVKNSVISGGRGFRIGGLLSEFVGNIIEGTVDFGLTTISPTPLVKDNKSYNNEFGVYHSPSIGGSADVFNLVLSDNQFAVRDTNNDYFSMNLVDCTSDTWNFSWASSANDFALVFRKFSYTILITDVNNVDIDAPVIGLFDKFSKREYKKTTGALAIVESFENGFGAWASNTSEGGDATWSRTSGSTPSSNTGPESASSGSFYLFCETSNPNNPLNKFDLFLDTSEATLINLDYQIRHTTTWTIIPKIEISEWDGSAWVLVSTFDTQSDATGTDWKNTGDVVLSGTSRIRIRATGGDGGGSEWNGDMAIDNVSVSALITEISGLTPVFGHYVASDGDTINEHGAHKLRIRKYGYFPSSALKEFTKSIFEKNALTVDPRITQDEATASSHAGIVITEALSNRNLALAIDPEFGDLANFSAVTTQDYSATTASPFPSHFTYKVNKLTANNTTVNEFYEIDVSADAGDIDLGDVTFNWDVSANVSDTNANGTIDISFRTGGGAEVSSVSSALTASNVLQQISTNGLIPATTRAIRIEFSLTGTTGSDRFLHYNMPELKITNTSYDLFGIKIDCGGNSLEDACHYIQYHMSQFGDFQGRDGIDWHNMLIRDGNDFKTQRGEYKFGVESTMQRGVFISNFSNGKIVSQRRDDGTDFIPAETRTLSFTVTDSSGTPITGYEWRIYESDASIGIIGLVELDGEEVAVSSGQSYTYIHTTDKPVVVQILNQPLNREALRDEFLLDQDQTFTIKLVNQENI